MAVDPSAPSPPAGPAVDARGMPVADPTENVLGLVDAAIQRQDDLRRMESSHIREMFALRDEATRERQRFNERLREAETDRINAIRAVDVGAATRAAEVAAAQAAILAQQVAAAAEALRAQVALTAQASAVALAAALEPITKSIEDLRRAQYEQQGRQGQQTEAKGSNQWAVGLIVSVAFLALAIAGFAISLAAGS